MRFAFQRNGEWHEGLRSFGLRMFTRDGMAAAAAYSMTSVFLSAFALALGADSVYIGLLSAVPMMFWTAALLPSALFCQKNIAMRKWIVVLSSLTARLLWIPIILTGLFFASSSFALGLLMAVVTLSTLVGALTTPAWSSLVGDLVPENMRGRYFSMRTNAATASGLAAALAAGWILDVFGRNNPLGFAVIFSVGLAISLVSTMFFSRIPDPPISGARHGFGPSVILDSIRDKRFRTFLIIFGIWQFGVMLSAPFFNIFLLKTLRAEYMWISVLAVAAGAAGILVQRGWGVFSDKYGHRVMVVISAFGLVPAILLWALASDVWMLLPVEIFSGMMWAGFSLAYYNYMLEASPAGSRPVYAAVFNVLVGIAGVAGPVAGGLAAQHFASNPLLGFGEYRALFLITASIRLVSGFLFLLLLSEAVEKRERVSPGYVFAEMLKYGIHGGIVMGHHAAGGLAKDAGFVKKKIACAAQAVAKDIESAVRSIEEVVDHIATDADKKGEMIVAGRAKGEACLVRDKSGKLRMRVKVSE